MSLPADGPAPLPDSTQRRVRWRFSFAVVPAIRGLVADQPAQRGRFSAVEVVIVIVGLLVAGVAAAALLAIRRQFAARERAEADLRLAKEDLERRIFERTRDLRQIVESSDDAIITKDLNGVITSWNPGATRIFGYGPNQAIGRSIQFIIPPERADEEPSILARLARGEHVDHFETERVRSDGTRIDVSATISPLHDGAGRVVGASKIARDITERRAHERKVRAQLERLHLLEQITRAIRERQDLKSIHHVVARSLQEDMPVDFACIAGYDADSGTVQLGDIVCGAAELARALSPAHGRSLRFGGLRQLIYEPDLTGSSIECLALLARCGLRSAIIKPLRVAERAFSAIIVARVQPSGFTSADSEFLHQLGEHLALASHQAELVGSLQAAYDDLRQTQQAAMQHERLRALGEMASGVAHDINNALAPPALYLQILLQHEKSISAEGREYLKIIERSIDDVAATIARLRLFYAVREPQKAVATVDLNQLVDQVAELTSARWRTMPLERGLVIELERRLTVPLPRIIGDEGEIRDALTNLVFNAVDAMPQGGTLTLRSSVRISSGSKPEPAAERVCLEIGDTGVGMTEAVRTRCLEPFFTTKGSLGSGLGLAMVYGMAQRHGGALEIDSAPGAGTTMRLLFPVVSDMPDPPTPPTQLTPVPRRILVIDDDPLVLKALCDALSSDGHSVVVADGAHRGIEEFARAHGRGEFFDAVFTDLGMPNLDGRFVAKSIKSLAPEVPVIMVTGWGRRLGETDEASPYIDRILSKPPKLPELRAALAELVRGAGASDPRDTPAQP